ncbi:MAG: hypothetical protein R3F56_21270 [Planctomycetota bacterium]
MQAHSTVIPLLTVAALLGAPRAQDTLADLVPAGAKFACYVDLQAMLDFVGRDLVQAAVARLAEDEGDIRLKSDWNERLAKDWGIDPLRDIEGLLVFGDDLHGREPNLALLTTDRIDVTLGKLREMGALASRDVGGTTIERLAPDQMLAAFGIEDAGVDVEMCLSVQRLGGRLRGHRALLVATDADKLLPALSAMRGAKANDHDGALTLATRPGCIAYVEVADVLRELMDRSPASRMANKATHLSMQLAENDGTVSFTAAVQTETAKDARQIAALVNGLKALVTLVEPDEDVPQEVLEALGNAHAECDGNRVSLEFEVSRSLIDEARRSIREELGGRGGARQQGAGKKSRRLIR